MKLKKILVGMVALFLMFGTVTPVFAMIPPAESEIFTTDADPSEIKRVAFFIVCDDVAGYYYEVEGYIVPKGTQLTMDHEVFVNDLYEDGERSAFSGNHYFDWAEMAYSGFSGNKYSEEAGSNTITLNYSNTVYEIIAKKNGKTEWMYFATEGVNKNCYRTLKDGEEVDSRKRVIQPNSDITIWDENNNKFTLQCQADSIRPVTFEIEENGTQVELDGFILKENLMVYGGEICKLEWNLEEYLGDTQLQQDILNGNDTGWYVGPEIAYGWSVDSTLSLLTTDSTPFAMQGAGVWIATEDVTGVTYRDRDPRLGEIEIITPEAAEEIEPLRLNKVNNYLNTTADGQDIKLVLFKIGDEKKEGFVFPASSKVGINKEIFNSGLYDVGYYEANENGIIEAERSSGYRVLDAEAMARLKTEIYPDLLYHIPMTNPATGEIVEVFFAFDTINPACYEVLEVSVEVESIVPVEPETEEPETEESEDTETVIPENDMTDDEKQEAGVGPSAEDLVKIPAIAVAATVVAGAVSAAGAGIMPALEVSSGIKARRGELHVNGDVDVPNVHFDDLEKLMVPVHISDGDGIVWVIVAKAFTPGIKDLVKAVAVPAGTDGANINLKLADDFKDKVKEEIEVYLEVVATGIDVNGECNILEKMVEIKILVK